jgi:hypothetical protein
MIEASLAQMPDWQPPAGFAQRVAARAMAEKRQSHAPWMASLLRGLALAACVSIAGWLGGEVLSVGLQSAAVQENPGWVSWMLALASVALAWRCIPRGRGGHERRFPA